jgi:hypothetical protein
MDRKLNNGTDRPDTGTRRKGQRLDLSVPQVAGSAVAAVAAAVLASQLGVYGTIAGAGVVSVIATCGGSVFQHFFRRTGEQIRDVKVQVTPRARQVPVRRLPGAPGSSGDPRDPGSGMWMLPQVVGLDEEFGEATTHGTRVRGWKRPALAAAVAFVVAMIGITGFELISGQDLSGGGGTTVGSVVGGSGHRSAPSDDAPANSPSPGGQGTATPGNGGGSGPSRSPGDGQSSGTGQGGNGSPSAPAPSPTVPGGEVTPSPSGGASNPPGPTPTPTPSFGAGGNGGQTPHGAGSGVAGQ